MIQYKFGKRPTQCVFLFFFFPVVINSTLLKAQKPASMLPALDGAYSAYCKYLDSTGRGMPANAAKSAKGVVAIQASAYSGLTHGGNGTAYFIRTSRSDGKICMVTAAHVIASMKPNPQVNDKVIIEMFFKYYGTDDNGRAKTISGIHTVIPDAKLVAYQWDEAKDFAILLIDKKQLPARVITTLGYDLNFIPSSNYSFYALGHWKGSPLRIADSLVYNGIFNGRLGLENKNSYTGPGFSGGPMFCVRPGNNDIVVAMSNHTVEGQVREIPKSELVGKDQKVTYHLGSLYLPLSSFGDEIRRYAQTNISSLTTSGEDPYLTAQEIDNTANWNAFKVDVSASNLTGLNNVSSTAYATENPNSKLVRARNLAMNFNYLASVATQNLVTNCLVSQGNLENGFSFGADNNTEFSIFAIIPEPDRLVSASQHQADSSTQRQPANKFENAAGINPVIDPLIYPNPSNTGEFTIELRGKTAVVAQTYTLRVFSQDGKMIFQGPVSDDRPNTLDIHQQARGTYVAIIVDGAGKILFRGTIIY